MKALPESPDEYFQKFTTRPVEIKPFNPYSREVAEDYLSKLKRMLSRFRVDMEHKGSTRFGIAGKGEIEIGVYPAERDWGEVLKELASHLGEPGEVEENYARFNDLFREHEIEIILLKGYDAQVDRKLTEYLICRPEVLRDYEDLKRKWAFSKREYQRQKDRFFRGVVRAIPD